MQARLKWESILKFKSADFSEECHQLKDIPLPYINFDKVKEKKWASLRSVDAIIGENPNEEITFIEFCDLRVKR